MNDCLDDSLCYWDQETDKCYNYDSTKQKCSEADSGKNAYIRAHTFGFREVYADDRDKRIRTGGRDACLSDSKILHEHYCYDTYFIGSYYEYFPNGCKDDVCISSEPFIATDIMNMSSDNYQCELGVAYDFYSLGSFNEFGEKGSHFSDNNNFIPETPRQLRSDIMNCNFYPTKEQEVTIFADTGTIKVYYPPVSDTTIFYIANDGSTYYDKELRNLARSSSSQCTDSDGPIINILEGGGEAYGSSGIYRFIQGITIIGNNTAYEDFCERDNLVEYACKGNDLYKLDSQECSLGCSNGKCNVLTIDNFGSNIYTLNLNDVLFYEINGEEYYIEAYNIDEEKVNLNILRKNGEDTAGGFGYDFPYSDENLKIDIDNFVSDSYVSFKIEGLVKDCSDSDGGKDSYIKGVTKGNDDKGYVVKEDYCWSDNSEESYYLMTEWYCWTNTSNGKRFVGKDVLECVNGCEDGACIRPDNADDDNNLGGIESNITEEVVEIQNCNGCLIEGTCYDLGYRKEGRYCSDDKIWGTQIESGGECENNFECDSYVCVSDECVNANLIQKILNWFRRFFGIE